MAPKITRPVTFFLNETHELLRAERDSGGGARKLAPIDWAIKGQRIGATLQASASQLALLPDPISSSHFYLLAKPQRTVKTLHDSKKYGTQTVEDVVTSYAGADSKVFTRLGVEMLRVTDDGSAIVHLTPAHAQQLLSTASRLNEFGPREQARWITVDSFELIPADLRLDEEWFQRIPQHVVADSVIELQPLLSRSEVDSVVRALYAAIQVNAPHGQTINGSGADFTGRQWLRAALSREALRILATNFPSIQTLHSPLLSKVAGGTFSLPVYASNLPTSPSANAPRVAIVDTGIPAGHLILNPFKQGEFKAPYNQGGSGQHGSPVASRVVFGDLDAGLAPTPTALRFFDVNIAYGPRDIDDKQLIPALQAVVGTSPDIRVFNLSFDNDPLASLSQVMRSERLILAQDLDNFAYQNDVLLVISAGNTPPGIVPGIPYPNHWSEALWQLGSYACAFNALTCGSYVSRLTANPSVVNDIGWSSPFCRVGPGLAKSFKPDFSAPGGNASPAYSCGAGLGVPTLNNSGQWMEACGTSFAAPLLAREAALAFQLLDFVSSPGSRPFAATVKAFLALTATPPVITPATKELATRTLGYGLGSSSRLSNPLASSAVFLWQGWLEDKDDIARVQVPIPKEWLANAVKPRLRLVVSADVPVNAAASEYWATRKVSATLHPGPESRAVTAQKRRGGETYPLVSQEHNLANVDLSKIDGDFWMVKLSYEIIADYLPSMSFASQQRVAFAAELYDDAPHTLSPQSLILAMPAAASMNRLSVQNEAIQTPVMIRY